jgi:hypothetical protein
VKHGRIYLHPNNASDGSWSAFTVGTFDDLRERGIRPTEGLRLQFYDRDADDRGNPDDLLFDGVAHFVIGKGWGAVIDAATFYWESDERKVPQSDSKS